jgi:hypothetical protein
MLKKLLLMAALAVAIPMASFASSVDFQNGCATSNCTISGGTGGLTLNNSQLTGVNGYNGGGLQLGNLGTVSFTTGALSSGTLQAGGTFSAAGSSFTITGNGNGGLPSGVVFSGSFSADPTWALQTLPDGTHNYTLTGVLSGTLTLPSGTVSANGVTVQLTVNTGKGYYNGRSVRLSSGDTNISYGTAVTPEPGTLSLLGTGLIGLAGVIRRKLKA